MASASADRKSLSGSAGLPAAEMAMPRKIAKKMMGSASPLARESKTLVGTIASATSTRLGVGFTSTFFISPIGNPTPGWATKPMTSAITIARIPVK
ncbi:MAG: hypothetical protein MUE48_06895 [Desulfobacterales bacterium]|nr:hypothetical protein [Desulfobacterales bacterium]